eukprot:TRINITY_DN324_c2_g2_i13.p1 TRINITY_DN324_c2_g2~~TRINITY_DN324_c2_g2_i13.p1  ORF type:complete len:237 (+),score=33.57 TRINITY_DN324_c2_g2_i13:73-711(+)
MGFTTTAMPMPELVPCSPSPQGKKRSEETPPPPLLSPSESPDNTGCMVLNDFRRTPGRPSQAVMCYSVQKTSTPISISLMDSLLCGSAETPVAPPRMPELIKCDTTPRHEHLPLEQDDEDDDDDLILASESDFLTLPELPELIAASPAQGKHSPLPELLSLSPGASQSPAPLQQQSTNTVFGLYRSRLTNPKRGGPRPPRPLLPPTACPWRL